MKKIFTLLCAIVLTLSAGAEIITVGNYKYEVTKPYGSSNAIMAGFKDGLSSTSKKYVYVNATIEYSNYTMKVVGIKESAFENETDIIDVTLNDPNLTSIGKYAFWGCTSLATLGVQTISSNLIIDEQAFWGCSALTGVGVRNMKQLCNGAFGNCANLNHFLFEDIDIISQGAFTQSTNLRRISWYNTKTVKITKSGSGSTTTYSVTSDEKTTPFYELRSQITEISNLGGNVQDYLFQGMTALQKVSIADVKRIGNYAFSNCTSLTELKYFFSAEDLTYIGDYAFSNCPITSDLNFMNDKLAYIGTQAFFNNHARNLKLDWYDYNQQVGVEVGSNAFTSAYTKKIIIRCKVKSLANRAFCCTEADSIEYRPYNGYTTNTASVSPFAGCQKVTYIMARFDGDLGAYFFYDCKNLRTLDLTCGYVNATAFLNCSNIEEVIWDAGTEYDYTASENPFKATQSISKVEFHGTRIPAFLFSNQTSLKKFTVGSAVTEIGNSAFLGAGLQYLTINAGDGTLNIRNNAFKNNSSLRIINCAYTTPPTLGDEVFLGCNEDLTNIDLLIPQEAESLYRVAKGWKDFFAPSEDIEEVMSNETLEGTRKVLVDGKVYIQRNDRLYDLNGIQVR